MKRETRSVGTIELRDEAAGNKLVGYAATFGQEYELYPGLYETIAPGAFARTLKEMPDIRALYNHDTNHVLGRTTAGTLQLAEDATGLAFEVDLPDTQAARDARELVKRKDITGCSFGFSVREESFLNRPDGSTLRTLLDVDLYEISPAVAFPAYEDTEVAVRALMLKASKHRAHPPQPIREHCQRVLRLLDFPQP